MRTDHFNTVKGLVSDKCEELYQEINEALGQNITDKNWFVGMEGFEREFLDNIGSCLKEGYTKELLAWVRVDITNNKWAVPVGVHHYGSKLPLPYRWINDETFEVFWKDCWIEAYSGDWDFTNKQAESGEGLPVYNETTLSLSEFMALPDKEKLTFFIRTYPERAGKDYHDLDIGVYPESEPDSCDMIGGSECSPSRWRIGTNDSREPRFCELHYRAINRTSDFIKSAS
jgi:hypothetical protein